MFSAEGLDVPTLLADAGFDTALLLQDARVPLDEISLLWRFAVARAGNPTLGLKRDLVASSSKLGTVGHAMACCPDLRSGIELVARYMPVLSDATLLTLEADPRGGWLAITHVGGRLPVPRQRVEYALLTALMQIRWLTRREIQPIAIEFAYSSPVDDRVHSEAFGCTPCFDASENRMLVSMSDLALPFPTHHPGLSDIQRSLLDAQLALLGQTTTVTLVRTEIARTLVNGEPRRSSVAGLLAMTERTLQRRLNEEGVSFQLLLDRTRRELAQQYLAQSRHSLGEISDLLGFADRSNFFRACNRWFGISPAKYQARLRNVLADAERAI